MTTFDTRPTARESVLVRFADFLISSARKSNRARAIGTPSMSAFQAFVRVVLHLSGFVCLTLAGFSINITVGYAMAALSLFAFDKVINVRKKSDERG